MSPTSGPDPVIAEVQAVLGRLARGNRVNAAVECKHLDLKEEPGRRDRTGKLGPSSAQSGPAAQALCGEAICMANTPGGGALIVGVANDGQPVGAELDAEWLRRRIYEKSDRTLTVDARSVVAAGTRLVVVVSPQAIEPIRWNNKIYWRLDDVHRPVATGDSTIRVRRDQRSLLDSCADQSKF